MAWKFNDTFATQEAALKKALKRATRTTAQQVKARAQSNAPVRTGRLRDSAEVVDVIAPSLGAAETAVAFTAPYAKLVHDGSLGEGESGTQSEGAHQGFRAPRPFLTDAMADSEDDLAAATAKELAALGVKRVRRYS